MRLVTFTKLFANGTPTTIDAEKVAYFYPVGKGTFIQFVGVEKHLHVAESSEEVTALLLQDNKRPRRVLVPRP